MKILIVEDDTLLLQGLILAAQTEGYACDGVTTARMAEQSLEAGHYSLVVLDLGLPDEDGLHFLARIRQKKYTLPVLILTARDTLTDKIAGLDVGADDYLAKPFHLAELHARLKSVIRRSRNDGDSVMRMSNVCVHTDSFRVEVDGKPLELGRKEYDILTYFMNRPGRLIEKQMLAEAVWGDYIDVADNFDFVYAQMKNLRKRLKTAGAGIEIKTVYGFGYKLVEI